MEAPPPLKSDCAETEKLMGGCPLTPCSALPFLDRLGTGVSSLGAIGDKMTIEKAERGYNVRKYISGNLDEIYLGVSKANLKELLELSAP